MIIYDISDDKCRTRIAKYLEGKGQRIQESAFECRVNEVDIQKITATLQAWIQDRGNVRIYPICANCMEKSIGIGEIRKIIGQDGYAIF